MNKVLRKKGCLERFGGSRKNAWFLVVATFLASGTINNSRLSSPGIGLVNAEAQTEDIATSATCTTKDSNGDDAAACVQQHQQQHSDENTQTAMETDNDDDETTTTISEESTTAESLLEDDITTSYTGCGLYLAPSTVPNAGLGVFTAVEKQIGDSIGEGDICIPFIDMYWNNGASFFPNPFKDYFWLGTSMGMIFEKDSDDIEAFCPGLDCAVNCNPALINVAKATPIHDDADLHRSRDPGAGARSPYHNGTTVVKRHIPAGGELFKDYGLHWFEYRYDIFGEIPFEEHYEQARGLLDTMMKLKDQVGIQDDTTMKDLYSILAKLKVSHKSPRSSFEGRVLNALPDEYEKAKWAAQHTLQDLHQPSAVHSLVFLEQNGKCLDNIRPGRSTIKQAGVGAFATRNIPDGTVITASPLHHVEQSFANMYNLTQMGSGEYMRVEDQVVGQQLMMNYCYSHPDSTIMLCPYGSGINFINHDRTRANVRIRWAENFPLGHNSSFVESGPFSYFLERETKLVSFDYVATKDISEGDELFLDYGDEWIAAWEKHVKEWKPHGLHPERYASGRFMNRHYGKSILRTEKEQEHDPYPDNLQIRCHSGLMSADGQTNFTFNIRDYGLPCRILHREEYYAEYFYTVELEFVRPEEDQIVHIIKADIPRNSIAFFDMPGTTDINLPNVFRHTIGIPDDMFPSQWRNLLDDFEKKDERRDDTSKDEEAEEATSDTDSKKVVDDDYTFPEMEFPDDDYALYDDEVLFEELALEEMGLPYE